MNSHALSVLEFHRVLDVVADRATSEEGAERVRLLPADGSGLPETSVVGMVETAP